MPSTVDLAAAVAAIEARLTANWTTTRVLFDGADPVAPWPPMDGQKPAPWVFAEVIDTDAEITAFGTIGNQTIVDAGLLKMHVMTPKGRGLAVGRQHGVALGELFRQQQISTADPTAYIRFGTPQVGRGQAVFDDGNYASVSCTVPFEFFHRA